MTPTADKIRTGDLVLIHAGGQYRRVTNVERYTAKSSAKPSATPWVRIHVDGRKPYELPADWEVLDIDSGNDGDNET